MAIKENENEYDFPYDDEDGDRYDVDKTGELVVASGKEGMQDPGPYRFFAHEEPYLWNELDKDALAMLDDHIHHHFPGATARFDVLQHFRNRVMHENERFRDKLLNFTPDAEERYADDTSPDPAWEARVEQLFGGRKETQQPKNHLQPEIRSILLTILKGMEESGAGYRDAAGEPLSEEASLAAFRKEFPKMEQELERDIRNPRSRYYIKPHTRLSDIENQNRMRDEGPELEGHSL